MRLDTYIDAETALKLGLSRRTIHRGIEKIREIWTNSGLLEIEARRSAAETLLESAKRSQSRTSGRPRFGGNSPARDGNLILMTAGPPNAERGHRMQKGVRTRKPE